MSLTRGIVRGITRPIVKGVQKTQLPIPLLDMPLDGNLALRYGVGSATFTRSTTGTYVDKDDGLVKTAAINVARFEANGVLIEGASTNEALHSRDFTNAVHVKTGVTALKDAIGADGVASSASTLTATAPNGTAFQTVTKASAQNTFSIDIRRKTGTGTVEITDDGGSTFTDITALINSTAYTRFQITTTQANASFGPRIVTSGDEIEVDYEGLEVLPFASSRIPTVASTVTRTADNLSIASAGNFNETEGSITASFCETGPNDVINRSVFSVDDGTSVDRNLLTDLATGVGQLFIADGGVVQVSAAPDLGMTSGVSKRSVETYKQNDVRLYLEGSLIVTDTSATMPTDLTTINLGQRFNAVDHLYGHIKDLKTFDVILDATQVGSL